MPQTIICGLDDIPRVLQDAGQRRVDPDDPRRSGIQGAGNLDSRGRRDLPRLLYERVGLYRVIVDKPAQDIWDQGWALSLDPDDPDLARDVDRLDSLVGIGVALKRATIMARRDGKAYIVLRLEDASASPADEPRGVRRIIKAHAVPMHRIPRTRYGAVGTPREGEPESYTVRRGRRGDAAGMDEEWHWRRVIEVIQHPDEEDEHEGVSVLSWQITDSQGFENVKWGAAESYARYGAPLYAVTIDADVDFDPKKDGADLEEKLRHIKNNLTQRAWFKGAKFEAVTGSSSINPPEPYAAMFMDALAGGAQIPKRELTGSEAGALASAGWDEKRYFARITNERRGFAEPLLEEWYGRLDEWGLFPGLQDRIAGYEWPSHIEPTEKETADVMVRLAMALKGFATLGLPAPKETWGLLTWPDSLDEGIREAPLALTSGASPPQIPGGDSARRIRGDESMGIQVSAALLRLEDGFQRRLLDVYRAWWTDAMEALEGAGLDEAPTRRQRRRRGDGPEALLGLELDSEPLRVLVEAVLQDAMRLGASEMLGRLDRAEDVFDAVDSETWPRLKAFADAWGARKARAATEALRDAVAEAIGEGTGLQGLRRVLRERFGVLENETVVARTELMRGYNGGSLEAMRHAGVQSWRWLAYAGACEICQGLEGNTYLVTDAQAMPPDGSHPACRCVPEPIVV